MPAAEIRAAAYRSEGGEDGAPLPGSFNLYTNRLGGGEGFQLLHPHPYGSDPRVLKTGRGDALGQGLGQADMALRDDGPDALFDRMIVDHILQHILGVGDVVGGQVDIDAHRLGTAFLLAIDADM